MSDAQKDTITFSYSDPSAISWTDIPVNERFAYLADFEISHVTQNDVRLDNCEITITRTPRTDTVYASTLSVQPSVEIRVLVNGEPVTPNGIVVHMKKREHQASFDKTFIRVLPYGTMNVDGQCARCNTAITVLPCQSCGYHTARVDAVSRL